MTTRNSSWQDDFREEWQKWPPGTQGAQDIIDYFQDILSHQEEDRREAVYKKGFVAGAEELVRRLKLAPIKTASGRVIVSTLMGNEQRL